MDITKICEGAVEGPELAEALARLDRAEVEALIQQALHPGVPVGVLFAALDRYTALTPPVPPPTPEPKPRPESKPRPDPDLF